VARADSVRLVTSVDFAFESPAFRFVPGAFFRRLAGDQAEGDS